MEGQVERDDGAETRVASHDFTTSASKLLRESFPDLHGRVPGDDELNASE